MPARLEDLDLNDKRALIRVDFNVPLDEHRQVTSDARIRAALPTIRWVLDHGGRPILMSHLGRPKGQVDEALRLRPAGERLGELLDVPVRYATDCIGEEAATAAAALQQGECLLLENLRFHPEEKKGDPEFARQLASLADVYINDAFGTAHRAHASVAGIAALLPSAPGLLLAKEIRAFDTLMTQPAAPVVAILGGAKVADKLPVILNLLAKVDAVLIGGAMAYTFLKQQGIPIGRSRCEDDVLDAARDALAAAKQQAVELMLPRDHVCANEIADSAQPSVHGPQIPDDLMGLDIGPQTIESYRTVIAKAKTIVWNGPMGVFELPAFRSGTEAIARAVAESEAWSLVGGGDSVAAVELLGVADKIDHVSTGGGASLQLLEGKTLPGLAALG
ncbi:MAG: phosphoglycerate kinase [Planctomycetota bacterium]|jgi:phosphoglycerate kinase